MKEAVDTDWEMETYLYLKCATVLNHVLINMLTEILTDPRMPKDRELEDLIIHAKIWITGYQNTT
jgi:hypothetical protein